MSTTTFLEAVAALYAEGVTTPDASNMQVVHGFLDALEAGEVRAAAPDGAGHWVVRPEVKQGILVAFRLGRIIRYGEEGPLVFSDKDTMRPQVLGSQESRQRVVPGGSSIRRGAYVAEGVTCMPPMYINVGAWVGRDTMVDSHALVGSCAQVGERVHLSAAAQLGGVLEPIGLRPVVIEDDCLIGGGVGVYEGTLVRKGAVLGAGVQLTASTPVYDIVREQIYRATEESPLEIPEGAVVVAGARPLARNAFAAEHGLQLQCPIIVKYRDDRTNLKAALEGDLR